MRIHLRPILLVGALLLLAGPALAAAQPRSLPAQSLLTDEPAMQLAEAGIDALYNMEFDAAQARFDQLEGLYPDHPVGPFLDGLMTWWEVMVDLQNRQHDKRFLKLMDETIRRADRRLKVDKNDLDGLFFKSMGLSFRSRLRSNRSQELRAARDGKRALDLIIRLAEQDAQNDDFYFGWGVYDYYADVAEERYSALKLISWAFPNGDKERGIAQLERSFKNGRFLKAEAAYFLFQIYYFYEKNFAKSIEYITWLRMTYPGNAVFHALEGRMYARFGRWDRVGDIFAEVLRRHEAAQTGYGLGLAEQAFYYLARNEMRYGDVEGAIPYLRKLDDTAARLKADTPYKVLGRLRQGMVLDRMGHRDGAVMRYKEVLSMKDWSGAHRRAKAYLKKPYR